MKNLLNTIIAISMALVISSCGKKDDADKAQTATEATTQATTETESKDATVTAQPEEAKPEVVEVNAVKQDDSAANNNTNTDTTPVVSTESNNQSDNSNEKK